MTAADSSRTPEQDRAPNFRENGKLYLVRCFACGGENGKENWGPAVATGSCAWCGWSDRAPRTSYELLGSSAPVESLLDEGDFAVIDGESDV